ncbi:MAG: hypothetical protein P8R42_03410 [Candidatus Binatia bacterium]|nr:hypothetical protein [Candidatus Binatia bacterium]
MGSGAPRPNRGRCAGLGRRLRDQAGWTLAELMVVTGLIVTLAGIAVPQFSLMAVQMRTQAAAAQVMSDLNWARTMSLRTGVAHYINVTGDPPMIYDVHRVASPGAVVPATDPVIRAIDLTARMPDVDFSLNGVTLDPYGGTVTGPSPGQIIFTGRGLPTAPGAFFVASDDGKTAFAISITGAGRTRMWRRGDGAWK